jgi:hypothetical protein
MKLSENWSETSLEKWFASLRIIAPRDPGSIQRGRQAFLAQASTLTLPVSQTQFQRPTGWIFKFINQLKSKKYSPMFTTFASLFLVIALLFGGSGAAAVAAQSSLPDQPLYQIKTLTEDLILGSSVSNTHRLQLEFDFADRRVTEVIRLREMQQLIPQSTYLRFENHINQALQLAASSENGEMMRSLNQIRERLQNQMSSLPAHDPEVLRIREMVQLRIGWTDFGLEKPNAFRQRAQLRTRFNQEAQSQERGVPMPDFGPGKGAGANDSVSQGEESRNNDYQFDPCGLGPEHCYGQDQESDENQMDGKDSPGTSFPAANPNQGFSPNFQQGPGNNSENNNANQNATQENGSPQGNGGTH